ncbi:MAG: dephospho-CoA kinase, partial [Armatimonadetes bacterium]|nr:dephospho-CoA kinase [Armatimonadota bacterium]
MWPEIREPGAQNSKPATRSPKPVIALAVVGPIASGKSTVLRLLRDLGAETCSADELARELTAPGRPALEQIIEEFGERYRRGDGSLDRQGLAELIFESSAARE